MSDTKHTPGPWEVQRHRKDRPGPFFIRRLVGKKEGVAWEIDSEDDARLIASAPDLLEAARLALREMCHTVAPRTSFTDAVDALDAAIAKATPSPNPEDKP